MIPFLKNDLEPLRIKQKDPQLEHGQKMFKMQILTLSLREPLFIPNFWEGLNLSQTSTTFSDYRLALRNGTVLDYLTNEKCFLSKHEYSLVKKWPLEYDLSQPTIIENQEVHADSDNFFLYIDFKV